MLPWVETRGGEHCENGRVWMVEGDGIDGVEVLEVVPVRSVVPVPSEDRLPGHHVERTVVHGALKDLPAELIVYLFNQRLP